MRPRRLRSVVDDLLIVDFGYECWFTALGGAVRRVVIGPTRQREVTGPPTVNQVAGLFPFQKELQIPRMVLSPAGPALVIITVSTIK